MRSVVSEQLSFNEESFFKKKFNSVIKQTNKCGFKLQRLTSFSTRERQREAYCADGQTPTDPQFLPGFIMAKTPLKASAWCIT